MSQYLNIDCMDAERGLPSYSDNYFQLALVDPPYGIGASKKARLGVSKNNPQSKAHSKIKVGAWDDSAPSREYFEELFRVSKNQIICGANYFELPPSRGIVCWDKGAGLKGRSFSEWEYVWTSFDRVARIFYYDLLAGLGFITNGSSEREDKIHPTQKPMALYRWLCKHYAKPGDLILDTHVGSASSLVVYEELGLEYHGFEIDADYYNAGNERLETYRRQGSLFTPKQIFEATQMAFDFNTNTTP
jgi:site-specific DNA-methyltransferase (adenine-specific)